MKELLSRAEAGELVAMEELASMYYYGQNDFATDGEKARYWYEKIMEIDPQNTVALNALGSIYYFGYGVPIDHDKGISYIMTAANLGDAIAQYNIGADLEGRDDATCVEWFEKAFSSGVSHAAFKLSFVYLDGTFAEKDISKGIEWLKKGSDAGDSDCQQNLACHYICGEIIEKNLPLAISLLTTAAENGNGLAMENLALMYEKGSGVERDYEKAYEWYTRAVQNGETKYAVEYALLYVYGDEDFPQSIEKGFELLYTASSVGDIQADYWIGYFYAEGKLIEKSYEKALPYLESAGIKGHKKAIDLLLNIEENVYGQSGVERYHEIMKQGAEAGYYECMYQYGMDLVNGNKLKAVELGNESRRWIEKAAEGGIWDAIYCLAIYSFVDSGDYSARKWFELGIENGDPVCLMYKADYVKDGLRGFNKDAKEAFMLYVRSAELGVYRAMYKTGLCYEEGSGVPVDYNKAFYYIEKSAKSGYGEAILHLAHLYETGHLVTKDQDMAETLYKGYISEKLILKNYAKLRLALLYIEQKRYTEALYLLEGEIDISNLSSESQIVYYEKLAELYENGYGVTVNEQAAIYYYKQACDLGGKRSKFSLALLLANQTWSSDSVNFAMELYDQITDDFYENEENRGSALYQKGILYYKIGKMNEAVECLNSVTYRKECSSNLKGACHFVLGIIYSDTNWSEYNLDLAESYYKKSIEYGYRVKDAKKGLKAISSLRYQIYLEKKKEIWNRQ